MAVEVQPSTKIRPEVTTTGLPLLNPFGEVEDVGGL